MKCCSSMRTAMCKYVLYLSMKWICLLCLFFNSIVSAQPLALKQDRKLSRAIEKILIECKLDSAYNVEEAEAAQVSVAVITTGKKPKLAGVNVDRFIYPASVYKMYVAMEILKQVSEGKFMLSKSYVVTRPNDVDRSREITSDPRPLLRHGDTVTINYLLDLMITRSDNSAANCLIDIAGRPNINRTMQGFGWTGSEVTRKFLSRKLEEPGFDSIRSTVTNARHAAEFMYRVETNRLVNSWVSKQMKALLARQLDNSKLAAGLPGDAMFSHKTGWWSFYTHDVGIVETGKTTYILAVFNRFGKLKSYMRSCCGRPTIKNDGKK